MSEIFYISSWTINTSSITAELEKAFFGNKIKSTDIVWYGPSGDVVVASNAADIDEEYGDYTDKGQVREYLPQ